MKQPRSKHKTFYSSKGDMFCVKLFRPYAEWIETTARDKQISETAIFKVITNVYLKTYGYTDLKALIRKLSRIGDSTYNNIINSMIFSFISYREEQQCEMHQD